jgi:hypothetical protein
VKCTKRAVEMVQQNSAKIKLDEEGRFTEEPIGPRMSCATA